MRLFIAINFNNDTRSRLLALRDELHSHSASGNFSLSENLHLTLAFLGECDMKQTTATKTVLDSLAVEPMSICVDRIGRSRRDGGDIWCAGITKNEVLLSLQQMLINKLVSAGFILEKRRYSPHITLGREIVTDVQPWPIEPFGETVCSVELMKSERIGGKLTYAPIHRKVRDKKNV